MRCIPRILGARNARAGRVLPIEELEDIAQNVFALIWRKLDTFRGDAPIEAWVYPFCVLQFLNGARRQRRRPQHTEYTDADMESATDHAPASSLDPLDADWIHAALDRVNRVEAEVIRLKQFGALTFEAISERMGTSTNTAKTRYYRGLEKLRAMLEARFQGDDGAADDSLAKPAIKPSPPQAGPEREVKP